MPNDLFFTPSIRLNKFSPPKPLASKQPMDTDESASPHPLESKNSLIGDGTQRQNTRTQASRLHSFFQSLIDGFKRFSHALHGVFSTKIRAKRADQAFINANQDMVKALAQPCADSLANNPQVINTLCEHARASGTPISPAALKSMVIAGENIAIAIDNTNVSFLNADIGAVHSPHQGDNMFIRSNIYTTRALSWYWMAKAAKQDLDNPCTDAGSNLNGRAFSIPDPGNKFYIFLNQAPTRTSRSPRQKVIGDHGYRLPGKTCSSIRFEQSTDEQLHFEFKRINHPKLFSATESHEQDVTPGRFFQALRTNLTGTFMCRSSTDIRNDCAKSVREQHLPAAIYDPFMQLIQEVRQVNDNMVGTDKEVRNHIKQLGLPYVKNELTRLYAWADQYKEYNQGVASRLQELHKEDPGLQDRYKAAAELLEESIPPEQGQNKSNSDLEREKILPLITQLKQVLAEESNKADDDDSEFDPPADYDVPEGFLL